MTTISFKIPEGADFCSLKHTSEGWEATMRTPPRADKWGNEIPPQIGWAFKGKEPQATVTLAAGDALKKYRSILSLRNSRPDPNAVPLSQDDELARMLGL